MENNNIGRNIVIKGNNADLNLTEGRTVVYSYRKLCKYGN